MDKFQKKKGKKNKREGRWQGKGREDNGRAGFGVVGEGILGVWLIFFDFFEFFGFREGSAGGVGGFESPNAPLPSLSFSFLFVLFFFFSFSFQPPKQIHHKTLEFKK